MLKQDQHCHSLFAVKMVTRCVNRRKFRDPHDPYNLVVPGYPLSQTVTHAPILRPLTPHNTRSTGESDAGGQCVPELDVVLTAPPPTSSLQILNNWV